MKGSGNLRIITYQCRRIVQLFVALSVHQVIIMQSYSPKYSKLDMIISWENKIKTYAGLQNIYTHQDIVAF